MEEERRRETRVLRVQTKVSLRVAPWLQVLCTLLTPLVSRYLSLLFLGPLHVLSMILSSFCQCYTPRRLHPAECLVARCIKRMYTRSPDFSPSFFFFLCFFLFLFLFSSWS